MKNPWQPGMAATYLYPDVGVLVYRVEESPKDYEINLKKRIFQFAVDAMDLFTSVPYTKETDTVRFQLAKCAVSVGAKYEASQRTGSPSDVQYKMGSALQQTRETRYWLEVMERMGMGDKGKIRRLITESDGIKITLEKDFRNIL